ncbi:MAG: hypothetical protein RLZZ127_3272 [Planctomycetota bacterium]|jgi:uncharacterized protein
MDEAQDREQAALAAIRAGGPAVVAFSAGVDSTYLLALAHEALGDGCTALTADSPSLARSGLAAAQGFCAARGIRHLVVPTDEFTRADYRANDGRRCFHCKSALLDAVEGALRAGAAAAPGAAVLLGVIADDLTDWRPGMQAAAQRGARFPLADAGLTKAMVRARSRARGLAGWDRPAEPCLSSRVPYGEPVDERSVRMIEAAEAVLHRHGFAACRARHHRVGAGPDGAPRGFLCRIEVPPADIGRVAALAPVLAAEIRACGYASVAVDLAGLESGGFNRLLAAAEKSP